MSWLTVAWSMCAAASAMFGFLHLLLWWKDRGTRVYILASLMALGATGNAAIELFLMHAHSVSAYQTLLKWEVLFVYILLVAMAWFVYLQLGTARRWLAGIITLLWTIALVFNFVSPGSLIYTQVETLAYPSTSWGESFSVGLGPPNPWNMLTNLAVILMLVYTIDAALRSWRRGHRRPAAVVGGSIVIFLLFGGIQSLLVDHGIIVSPYMISFAFLAIVAALSYELVSSAVQVRRYARQLDVSEQRWNSFLARVELAVAGIDAAGNISYVNPYLERLTGHKSAELIGKPARDLVMPAETTQFDARLREALRSGPRPRSEWTLVSATGESRKLLWSTVRIDAADGKPAGFISIGEDITERLETQKDLQSTQREMQRLARLNMAGELTSALAHELNQPLAAILSNAQAARRLIAHLPEDMEELREILDDIIRDDKRAGGIIHSLRAMLGKGEIDREQVSVNEAIGEVLELFKAELEGEHTAVDFQASAGLPLVPAGRVEIQQVVMNLIHNAINAVRELPVERRQLMIRTQVVEDQLVTRIQDSGRGIAEKDLPHVFDAFFTKRGEGLGMGLAICQRIIAAHGGEIRAGNAPGGGAEVSFSLPIRAAGMTSD